MKFEELLNEEYKQLDEISRGVASDLGGVAGAVAGAAYVYTAIQSTLAATALTAMGILGLPITAAGVIIAGAAVLGFSLAKAAAAFASGNLRTYVSKINKILDKREKLIIRVYKLKLDLEKNAKKRGIDDPQTIKDVSSFVSIGEDIVNMSNDMYVYIEKFFKELDKGVTDDTGAFRTNLNVDELNELVAFYKIIINEEKLGKFITKNDISKLSIIKQVELDWSDVKADDEKHLYMLGAK